MLEYYRNSSWLYILLKIIMWLNVGRYTFRLYNRNSNYNYIHNYLLYFCRSWLIY